MKNKLYSKFKIFEYLTSRSSYKIFFILLIIMVIFGRLQIPVGATLATSLIVPFSSPFYHYILLAFFTYNTITTCKMFDEEFDELFIRYGNKNVKIKIVIANITFITLYSLLLFFLLYIAVIYFTASIGNASLNPYSISNVIYSIYTIFKVVLIMVMFQIINTILYFLVKEKLLIITILYFVPFYTMLLDGIGKFYIFVPWLHQVLCFWNSFLEDLLSFGLCIVFLNIIIVILYKIYKRRA